MPVNEFENLARASFAGVEFPVEGVTVMGSGRHHVHVYAHVHGGDPEKLGRNLYEFEMKGLFVTSATNYPGLWPGRLATLRTLFEAQVTEDLVVPTVGKIKAFCTNWSQEMTARLLNGERATLRFLEDQASAFLIDKLISVNTKSVQAASQNLAITLEKLGLDDQADIFDNIQALANAVFAVRDQIELAGILFQERCEMLANLCAEADKTVDFMNDPRNWTAVDANRELQAAAVALRESVQGPGVTFANYTVRVQSTISQVATAIYGSTARATEILQLNAIENAFDIKPGTVVRYIVEDTTAAAA